MKIHVVVPAYNAMDYLPACLDSIGSQSRHPDTVTVIDDASTDRRQVDYLHAFDDDTTSRWRVVFNKTNQEVAHNLWDYHLALDPAPDDVIVEVDGDDRLADGALERIARAYENPDVWLTYGGYRYWPDEDHWNNPALPYPPEVVTARSYRHHNVLFNHPETWRAFLWQRLAEWELQMPDGSWIQRTWDYAAMMPLLELAGTHWVCLPDVNYLYTHTNPTSHVRLAEHRRQADAEARVVRSRPPRPAIEDENIANPRLKRDVLRALAEKWGLFHLVETGTGIGDLCDWVRHDFRQVYTVELDEKSYQRSRLRFRDTNVRCYPGDSAAFLKGFAWAGPGLFFLDAHYSGPGTARGDADTPVMEELEAIYADGHDHVVVIDDARLFGTDPNYPTMFDIGVMASPRWVSPVGDLFIIEPRTPPPNRGIAVGHTYPVDE